MCYVASVAGGENGSIENRVRPGLTHTEQGSGRHSVCIASFADEGNTMPERGRNHGLEPAFATSGTSDWLFALTEWLRRVFDCWHRELSRPFTIDGETYRVCIQCGARQRFIAESWRSVGDFYHNSDYRARKVRRRNSQWRPATQGEHTAYRTQTPIERPSAELKKIA